MVNGQYTHWIYTKIRFCSLIQLKGLVAYQNDGEDNNFMGKVS